MPSPLGQVSIYDVSRGSNIELVGRLFAHDSLGNPICLGSAPAHNSTHEAVAIFGDTTGAVAVLHGGQFALPARMMLDTADRKDFRVLHRAHTDWVTRVRLQSE